MKFKKGDQVKIVSGNEKGKEGKILAVFPMENKVVVEGVNMKKKHMRPRQQGKKGEMVTIPAPFPTSRIMRVCPKCGAVTRIAYQMEGNIKIRVCKKCGATLSS